MDSTFIIATGFWRIFLERLGLAAITMPWRKVYILACYADHEALRRHELVHIEQIERDGAVLFSIKYLFWLLRYGYWDNPYEAEAYARAPIE